MKSDQLIEKLGDIERQLDGVVGKLAEGNRMALAKHINAISKKVAQAKIMVGEVATLDSQIELPLPEAK